MRNAGNTTASVPAIVACALSWCAAAAEFTAVDRAGQPACAVVIRTAETPPVKTALNTLVEYVERSTGARLPVISAAAAGDGPTIILGLDSEAPEPRSPRHRTKDGFTVDVAPGRIVISGDNPPSLIYGVCRFLEKHLGVRWLAPGELWTVVPERQGFVIPVGRHSEQAGFDIRGLHTTGVQTVGGTRYAHWHFDAAGWAMHNRINRKVEHVGRFQLGELMAEHGIKPLRAGHSLKLWMPNGLFFEEHPDYYAYDGNRRVPIGRGGTQLNYSSIEMSEVFAHRVIDRLREGHPQADRCGISLNDGYGFSVDPQSKAEWFYDGDGMPIVSDSVFGFTNRVAEIVSRAHPDVRITQLAYTPYYHRPPRFPIHPNVGIRFTMYRGSAVHPMCEGTNERDRQMRWELEEWRKKTEQVVVAEYLTTYWADAMFASGVRMIASDLQWYGEMGFPGCYSEYQVGKPAREMMYVYAKMLWNPHQDYMDIVRDFYASAYGAAAGEMLEAYDEYWRAALRCGFDGAGTELAVALSNVTGFRQRTAALLNGALSSATGQRQKERIRQVRLEFDEWMARAEPYALYTYPFRESTRENLADDNAVPNPSFEEELTGWTFSSGSPLVTGKQVSTEAWDGRKVLAIVSPPDQAISARAQWHASVPVVKGALYRVEIMVKPDRQAVESMSTLVMHTGGTDHRRGKAGPALMKDKWQSLGLGVCRANSESISIIIRLYRGAGTWHLDGLRVQELEKRPR